MRLLTLVLVVFTLASAPLYAAAVTGAPAGMSTEAVAAFRRGLEFQMAKQ